MMGHIFNYTNQQKWKTRDAVYCFEWAFPGVDWESMAAHELSRVWNLVHGEKYGNFNTANLNFVDVGEKVCNAWLKMKAEQENKVTEKGPGSIHVESSLKWQPPVKEQVAIEKLHEAVRELGFQVTSQIKTQMAFDKHLNDRINKLEKDDAVAKIARLEKELEQETVLRNALYDSLKKQLDCLQIRFCIKPIS